MKSSPRVACEAKRGGYDRVCLAAIAGLVASTGLSLMEVDYAFLANNAAPLQDGRLCIFGAEIDGFDSEQFPVVAPSFALVGKISLRPDEPLDEHNVQLEITKPNGEREPMAEPIPLNFCRNRRSPELPGYSFLVLELAIGLDAPGLYQIHVLIDRNEAKTLSLFATQIAQNEQ